MKETEKLYLLKKCQEHYLKALAHKTAYEFLLEWGKARGLKEVIENLIDYQPSKYYKAYEQIVRLERECRRI